MLKAHVIAICKCRLDKNLFVLLQDLITEELQERCLYMTLQGEGHLRIGAMYCITKTILIVIT